MECIRSYCRSVCNSYFQLKVIGVVAIIASLFAVILSYLKIYHAEELINILDFIWRISIPACS